MPHQNTSIFLSVCTFLPSIATGFTYTATKWEGDACKSPRNGPALPVMARPVDDDDEDEDEDADTDAPWDRPEQTRLRFRVQTRTHTSTSAPTHVCVRTDTRSCTNDVVCREYVYVCTHCDLRRPLERGKVHKRCIHPGWKQRLPRIQPHLRREKYAKISRLAYLPRLESAIEALVALREIPPIANRDATLRAIGTTSS